MTNKRKCSVKKRKIKVSKRGEPKKYIYKNKCVEISDEKRKHGRKMHAQNNLRPYTEAMKKYREKYKSPLPKKGTNDYKTKYY